MARELHMTVSQFLASTTSAEITGWMAYNQLEAEAADMRRLIDKAASADRNRKG